MKTGSTNDSHTLVCTKHTSSSSNSNSTPRLFQIGQEQERHVQIIMIGLPIVRLEIPRK